MKFISYRRGPVVKNSLGEPINLIVSRKEIIANSYKEALKKRLN